MTYQAHPFTHPDAWPRTMRLKDIGVGVASWQATLEALDYDIDDHVGIFGDSTHNATMAFQKLRGLDVDGIVGNQTKSNITTPARARSVVIPGVNDIPFIQARNYTTANRGPTDIKWIVLHSMETGESATTAEAVSKWFAGSNAPKSSAHYNIDSDSIVQSVKIKDIAWAAPGANRYGIHIEHAGRARQTMAQWRDAFSESMLQRSALLVARLCVDCSIPIYFVPRDELDTGTRGITTHNEVTRSNLSDRGSHTDPGKNFPMDWYLGLVSDAADQL